MSVTLESERENTQRLMTLKVVSNVADYVCKISGNLDRCVFSALWLECKIPESVPD